MQIEHYVSQVQSQLTATAALGDDFTQVIADALATAAEAAVRLALLGVVSAAADEITAALLDSPGAPAVSVRLDGDEVRVEVHWSAPPAPRTDAPGTDAPGSGAPGTGAEDNENTARISLRLPETLKGDIDAAARANGVSVNTWILRAASSALSGSGASSRRSARWDTPTGYRLTGWING